MKNLSSNNRFEVLNSLQQNNRVRILKIVFRTETRSDVLKLARKLLKREVEAQLAFEARLR